MDPNKSPRSYILGVFAVLLILGTGGIIWYALNQADQVFPLFRLNTNSQTPNASPEINIYIKDKNSLLIVCKNLPTNTAKVKVYRSKTGQNVWTEIPIKDLFPLCTKEAVAVTGTDDASLYEYYSEALSDSGESLWQSSKVPAQTGSPTGGQNSGASNNPGANQNNPNGAPPNGPNTPPSGSPNPGTINSTSTAPPPSNPPPGGTIGNPPPPNPNNPNVNVIPPVHTEPFWVEHVNQQIEIGWQNLSANSVQAIVYRSNSQSGPWSILLKQNLINPSDVYVIRLVDNALNSSFYYKLITYDANGAITQTYDSVLLGPLNQTY